MEWLSLAELAGTPVIRWVIQVIRGKVRKSIEKNLSVIVEYWDAVTSSYWCPILFTIVVDSKTPAQLYVTRVDFLFLHNASPVQSGYWRAGMEYETNGYDMGIDPIQIPGNDKCKLQVSLNPIMLGAFPPNSNGWSVKGTIQIGSAYGTMDIPFSQLKVTGDPKRWDAAKSEFAKRFPYLVTLNE